MSFLSFCLGYSVSLSSFEIEGEGDDFGSGFIYAESVGAHRLVLQAVSMACVETVGETVHEFQFRSYLEEGHVEVTTEACFQVHVITFEFEIAVVRSREIDGRSESQHGVGAMVAHSGCCRDKVKRTGEVDGLQVLRAVEHRVGSLSVHVVKLDMARAKENGRPHGTESSRSGGLHRAHLPEIRCPIGFGRR